GKCKFGASCTFSHEPQGRIPVCPFFQQRGSCRYGNSCKFLHHIPTAGVAESGAREQEESRIVIGLGECCGICLENIPASGKRFGLLNCDHAYCLECLRTWRKSEGPQKDISRTCPECRKVSFFLVPSKEHLKGRAKLKAIQAYKKGLSKFPCKYHKADRSAVCPFGVRCFYAHLDKNGRDVKNRPPPRTRRQERATASPSHRGRYGGVGQVVLPDAHGDHVSILMRLELMTLAGDN
ncbi:unnamed protein product, partial [Ascophyllum nodosum]